MPSPRAPAHSRQAILVVQPSGGIELTAHPDESVADLRRQVGKNEHPDRLGDMPWSHLTRPAAEESAAAYYAQHLGHSMRVLAVAPGDLRIRPDTNDLLYAGIMIDAFYVNLRLLTEFLLDRGHSKDDVGMSTFGVDRWSPPKTIKKRLERHHKTASKFVTHNGKPRVPADDPTGPVAGFAVDIDTVAVTARDVLTAMDLFITQVPGDDEKHILREAYDWAHELLAPDTNDASL